MLDFASGETVLQRIKWSLEDEGDNDVVEKDVSDNLVSALDPWFRLFFEFTLTSIGECLALLSGESISSPKESDCGEVGGWPAL